MAELYRSISEFPAAASLPVGSLFLISVEDSESASGYDSLKITSELVGSQLLGAYSWLTLNTTSKNIIGAVNELEARPTWKDVTGTLLQGETSLTVSDAAILATSTIETFVDPAFSQVSYESIVIAAGSVTYTFPQQASDMPVKVRIS